MIWWVLPRGPGLVGEDIFAAHKVRVREVESQAWR